jgi:hypothetical protein
MQPAHYINNAGSRNEALNQGIGIELDEEKLAGYRGKRADLYTLKLLR